VLLLEEKKKQQAVRDDFLSFVKHLWPNFIEGEHHKIMAEKFNKVQSGEIKRLIINMAPRHTKSEFASNFLPAWMIGKQPDLKIIQATHNAADLTGKLQKAQKEPKADQWEVIEFPAIMPSGKPVWPEYWKLEELESVKASVSIGKWNAQYQQNPTAEEGSIIKREWWKEWPKDTIPPLAHVIQSYDTAFMKKETSDYSAITTWGVFYPNEEGEAHLMLLDVVKDRFEFPELRRVAKEQYDYWSPETVIIEAKASGLPLTYELRKMGIPVINFTPSKGNDKHTRVNAVAPMFEAGMIWYPDRKFAEEVIEECAAFPLGEHDDLVDSTTQAVMRFRQGGFVEHPEDYDDEPVSHQQRTYY
jgi:predicted phage terminase large subunit-like protein